MIRRMADTVDLLAKVPLLEGLERKHLERLARSFKDRQFREGDAVVTEGERGGFFFVIVDGSASVNVGGEPRASLGPGDAFGEMALIDDGPRSATVVAATDMRCLTLTPWEFRPFLEDHPAVAWNLLQALAKRLRIAENA